MLTNFVPDKYQKSVFSINYKKLKREGFKCIIFDLDNTLAPTTEINPNKRLMHLIDSIKQLGFKVIIMSNSPKSRVEPFQTTLLVDSCALSFKPRKDKYEKILKLYNFKEKEVCAVGDGLVTDVYGANKMGITSIYVNSMSKTDHYIKFFNKILEKRILKKLNKKELLIKEKYYD